LKSTKKEQRKEMSFCGDDPDEQEHGRQKYIEKYRSTLEKEK